MAEGHRAGQTVRTASGASSPSTSFQTPKQVAVFACLGVESFTKRQEPLGTCSQRIISQLVYRLPKMLFYFPQAQPSERWSTGPRGSSSSSSTWRWQYNELKARMAFALSRHRQGVRARKLASVAGSVSAADMSDLL